MQQPRKKLAFQKQNKVDSFQSDWYTLVDSSLNYIVVLYTCIHSVYINYKLRFTKSRTFSSDSGKSKHLVISVQMYTCRYAIHCYIGNIQVKIHQIRLHCWSETYTNTAKTFYMIEDWHKSSWGFWLINSVMLWFQLMLTFCDGYEEDESVIGILQIIV